MLYDNGPLLALYADLARVTGERRYARRRARHRRLAGARDARAGRRVLLEPRRRQRGRGRQVLRLDAATRRARRCSADEWAVVAPHYGLDRPPNFEGHAWNLRVAHAARRGRRDRLGLSLPDAQHAARGRTGRAVRGARARACGPGRDDKILTVVECARDRRARARRARARRAALGRPRVRRGRRAQRHRVARRPPARDAPRRARRPQRLSRRPRVPAGGAARADADALPARGFRLGARARRRAARALRGPRARRLLLHEPRSRALFHRTKPGHDNATPSGNGVAAQALIALGQLAGEPRYLDAARAHGALFAAALAQSPGGYSTLLAARRRPRAAAGVGAARRRCRRPARSGSARWSDRYRPSVRVFDLAGRARPAAALVKGARRRRAGAAAWVCRGTTCLPPLDVRCGTPSCGWSTIG